MLATSTGHARRHALAHTHGSYGGVQAQVYARGHTCVQVGRGTPMEILVWRITCGGQACPRSPLARPLGCI